MPAARKPARVINVPRAGRACRRHWQRCDSLWSRRNAFTSRSSSFIYRVLLDVTPSRTPLSTSTRLAHSCRSAAARKHSTASVALRAGTSEPRYPVHAATSTPCSATASPCVLSDSLSLVCSRRILSINVHGDHFSNPAAYVSSWVGRTSGSLYFGSTYKTGSVSGSAPEMGIPPVHAFGEDQ